MKYTKEEAKRIKEYVDASGVAVDFFNDMSALQGHIILEELLLIKRMLSDFTGKVIK